MSVHVNIGHSGQRLALDPNATESLDALRSWISQRTGIASREQILLTLEGKQVKAQNLSVENELYVFDAKRLSRNKAEVSASEPTSSNVGDFDPGTPPQGTGNQEDLRSWQELIRVRKDWALGLLEGSRRRSQDAKRWASEKKVIQRSLGVAVASLLQHVSNAEQKFKAVQAWGGNQSQEHGFAGDWERQLKNLSVIPARHEFISFMQQVPASSTSQTATLQDFVDVAKVEKAVAAVKGASGNISERLDQISDDIQSVSKSSDKLKQSIQDLSGKEAVLDESEPSELVREIRLMTDKMTSDLEHIMSMPQTPQSIGQASKTANLHTRTYIPRLIEHCIEMNELAARFHKGRDKLAELALDHMQTLSGIESQLALIYAAIKQIQASESDSAALAMLASVSRLPSVYGKMLVEAVRCHEWADKMKRESVTLQNDLAACQREEEERRAKWLKSLESVLKMEALRTDALGVEVRLKNEEGIWPAVTREELDDYVQTVKKLYGNGGVSKELTQAIKALDAKQTNLGKGVKQGSINEGGFNNGSLFLRGDDEAKPLREANIRLEYELRAQKSRVKKLEDLVHRQTQASRTTAGDTFASTAIGSTEFLTSQPMDDYVTAVRQRRASSIKSTEEKRLAKQIVELEAKLRAQQEESKRSDAETQKQAQEAISIKQDIMRNMEAQQREFAHERRTLERELAEAKERIEEAEAEIDRLMGTQEVDSRVSASEESTRRAAEHRLEAVERARTEAEERLQHMQQDVRDVLTNAHRHMAPECEVPIDLDKLAEKLEVLARRSAAHVQELESAVALAKSETASNAQQLAHAVEQKEQVEEELKRSRDELTAEQARCKLLEERLNNERKETASAHAKLKLLEEQLNSEQEASASAREKTSSAKEEAASAQARIQSLEEQLLSEQTTSQSKIQSLEDDHLRLKEQLNQLTSQLTQAQTQISSTSAELVDTITQLQTTQLHLQSRGERAQTVSHRLWTYNMNLTRLLERLGLAITHEEDGRMVIERASRLAVGSSDLLKSGTTSPPSRKPSFPQPSSPPLTWSTSTPDTEESQFTHYLSTITSLNIEVLCEAIAKRVRDFEYTAKKYNKEAKDTARRSEAYKERFHRLKSLSSSKLTVKDFQEGDLALFLPTRGQVKGAWAAFNIGCPHYFLSEKPSMNLAKRDFIVARITGIEKRTVGSALPTDNGSSSLVASAAACLPPDDGGEDPNPFDLSHGLTWFLVTATEELSRSVAAPATPGPGRTTVAAANVDAKGSIRIKRGEDASGVLSKSLDSRSSSVSSRAKRREERDKVVVQEGGKNTGNKQSTDKQSATTPAATTTDSQTAPMTENTAQPTSEENPSNQVRKDLLWGP
ncbi:hypothetical protein K470DRAFT_254747 [Piedraia hortae CBS 480.64]|uniref:Autophagy-related protein 11 n=1 Tax=Piedraia hortae CBS 480.64 TaxID=1314780 RepID=A0A6A7C8M4_9PEZI|nr:hypothetical protein K470DRAFT_254747 [Piedraia hortae CBS 480.64]